MIGSMWATMTSIGSTAAAKTQLNGGSNLVMPSWARSIVAVSPYFGCSVYEQDKGTWAKIQFESDDCNIIPYEILTNPINPYEATSGVPHYGKTEKYEMNCPLTGGEEIAIYGTLGTTATGPYYAGVNLIISDQSHGRQRFGKVGTLTSSGTSAAEVAGTAYSIHGAERLVEVTGIVTSLAIAQDDAMMGNFRITSGDFKTAVPCSYGYQPFSAVEADTDGAWIDGLKRYQVDIPTNKTCVLQDYCTFTIGPSTAGQFISAVMFEKVGH